MESAARLERVVEAARSELGRAERDTNWRGLTENFAYGAEETNTLARAMAESQAQGGENGDALVHAFILRQLEITMGFLSKLSEAMVNMQDRLERVEREVTLTEPVTS